MASKWLEERWEVLLPRLAALGVEQEEEMKRICQEELEVWRRRPSLKRAISLQKPLTETRNRIREVLPLREENGWYNPKSSQKEHLALKYLNFSTEEWIQMQMPREEKLETRRERPLPLARPWDVLKKVEELLQSQAWPELVVGIGLSTGRGIVEILHTGHFTRKSAYSLLFAAPMTVYEVLCVPFEVPTLVRVEVVLAAVDRVRQYFGTHFQGLRRREISQQCRPQIQEAAYKQVWSLVPLRPEECNAYKSLAHEVYPQLAAWLYCPTNVDPLVYMATIEHHRKILEATSEEERLTLALAAGYREYVVMDTQGVEDQRHGIRLGEPGVEVLSPFQETMPGESDSAGHLGHVWTLEEVKAAIEADPHIDDDWDEEDLEVLRLSLSTMILGKDGTIDRRRGIKLGEPGVKILEIYQPREEGEGEPGGKDDPEAFSLPPLMDEMTTVICEEKQEKKEDVSLPHLLACFIYEVQVNVIENDSPMEILDTLATLIEHAPAFVMELVEGFRRTPPEDQEEDYPSRLPSFVDGDAGERHMDARR